MNHILLNYATLFTSTELYNMRSVIGTNKFVTRRSHGLLGQDILSQFCCIKMNQLELFVDPNVYSLPADFKALRMQIKLVLEQASSYPKDFNDWEDDDFSFEDDEWLITEEEIDEEQHVGKH
jgi:hypothetical protein